MDMQHVDLLHSFAADIRSLSLTSFRISLPALRHLILGLSRLTQLELDNMFLSHVEDAEATPDGPSTTPVLHLTSLDVSWETGVAEFLLNPSISLASISELTCYWGIGILDNDEHGISCLRALFRAVSHSIRRLSLQYFFMAETETRGVLREIS